MSTFSPDELLDLVKDEQSFLAFAEALAQDRAASVVAEQQQPSSPYGPDAGGWENSSIEHFLESAVAWARSTDFGKTQGLAANNPWRQFAEFLYCGKIYE